MFGSTLHRGGNSTQVARWWFPSGEVDRSIVVSVVDGPTAVADPGLGPSDVLDMVAVVAGLGRRVELVCFDEGRPVPFAFVAQLAAGFCQSSIGEASAACSGTGEAFLLHHAGRIQSFDHDGAVGFGQRGGELVDTVGPDVGDPAVKPGDVTVRFEVAA